MINMLDHWLTGNECQWLTGKSGGTVSGRDEGKYFHERRSLRASPLGRGDVGILKCRINRF